MTWLAPLTSAAAAVRRLASASARPSVSLTGAASGPAESTETPQASGIGQPTTPDLTARAVRTCNRSKDDAERYLTKHQILDRRS